MFENPTTNDTFFLAFLASLLMAVTWLYRVRNSFDIYMFTLSRTAR